MPAAIPPLFAIKEVVGGYYDYFKAEKKQILHSRAVQIAKNDPAGKGRARSGERIVHNEIITTGSRKKVDHTSQIILHQF